MKTVKLSQLFPIVFLLIIRIASAQDAIDSIAVEAVSDTSAETLEEKITATVKKEIDEIKELLNEISNANETDTLACFELRKKLFSLNSVSYNVNKLEIYLKNGYLEKARLYANDSVLFHLDGVVNLYQYNRYSKLTEFISEENDSIPLSSVLRYLPSIDNENYGIENQTIILTPGNVQKCISTGTDLNSFLDVRVYSDLLALLGKEGNGLVQTEISSTIGYNNFDLGLRNFIPVHYFRPYFKLAKFDSEFQSQEVTEVLGETDINTTLFNQYAFATLGLDVNLVRIHAFQHFLDLNIGVDHKFSDINIIDTEDVTTVQATALYGGFEFRILKYKNFGMDLSFQAYYQRIWDDFIRSSDKEDLYALSGMELFFHPNNDPSQSIFLRFNSMHNIDAQDYFTQLQFGYRTKLNFSK